MKTDKNKTIALIATPAEQAKLEVLMSLYQRNTISDMLRFLIANGEKILAANNAVAIK